MIQLVDDLQRQIMLPKAPSRIVSLVPSETYNLFALGAGERLAGATDYCVEPEAARALPRIGGTKNADPDRIAALNPDLVLANQEENAKTIARAMEQRGIPIFVSFPRTVAAGVAHLERLATLLGLEGDLIARRAIERARSALRDAKKKLAEDERAGRAPLDAFVPIWMEPLMTISGETVISDALRLAGARNVFASRLRRSPLTADLGEAAPLDEARVGLRDTRYPRITMEELAAADPELILLPDEPHEFTEQDAQIFAVQNIRAAVNHSIFPCAGRDLMWPGARTAEGLPRLRALVEQARAASDLS